MFQVFAHAESFSMPKLPFLKPYDVHVYGHVTSAQLRNWWVSSGRWFFGRGHGREQRTMAVHLSAAATWPNITAPIWSSRDADVESARPAQSDRSPEMRVPSHCMQSLFWRAVHLKRWWQNCNGPDVLLVWKDQTQCLEVFRMSSRRRPRMT